MSRSEREKGEVFIPRNSTTPAVCRRLVKDWGDHAGIISCYGDATGGAGGSAKVRGSDWDIIRQELRKVYGDRIQFNVPRQNPRERPRVNAVNSRLQSSDGNINFLIDPRECPNIIKDFEGVRLLEGGSGEIDKKSDPMLTHLTDGIGYYVSRVFSIEGAREVSVEQI